MTEARDLADDYWAYYRRTSQLWNIDRGDVDEIEQWEDLSASGVDTRIARLREFAARATRVGATNVAATEVSLLAAVAFSADATAIALPWLRNRALVSGPMNFTAFLSVLVPNYGLVTRQHGDGYVTKLRGIPSFIDAWIDGMRAGLADGHAATRRGVANAIAQYDRLLTTGISADPITGQSPPTQLSAPEANAWRAAVTAAVSESVRPALSSLRHFLRYELLPDAGADDTCGLCHLPGGAEAYEHLLWAATSTTLSSDMVHELGLAELARLDDEYQQIAGPALGIDGPAAIRHRLRNDPGLRYATPDEIIHDIHSMIARARSEAPLWFGRLPRAECAVVAVNDGGMAYYTGPSPDGARPGTFYFDASDPSRWTQFALAPTTFHESIPGHHLQLSIAQELQLHPILGELEVGAFNEGWGLYAERLADEMGLYNTPLQRIGMLTLDSLRASRLVVDTGIHAKGWTRQRAVDFLHHHTALARGNVEAEIDRYIADPGQAASYMIGRLEIDRLRADAAQRLGGRFSIPAFHDTILHGGMTPLGDLTRRIQDWVHQ
jgi:uncharacterized protein (DUF885 family)